jgi:hypothetical protein
MLQRGTFKSSKNTHLLRSFHGLPYVLDSLANKPVMTWRITPSLYGFRVIVDGQKIPLVPYFSMQQK